MAQGEIEGNVACCKLGAQGVNVQRLAAGECYTGGVHFTEQLQDFSVAAEIVLAVLEVKAIAGAAADLNHRIDGTHYGAHCRFIVACNAVDPFAAQLLCHQCGIIYQFLQGLGGSRNAHPIQQILVVEQATGRCRKGQGVDSVAPGVDALHKSAIPETSLVLLRHIRREIQQHLLFVHLHFQRVRSTELEHIRCSVGAESEIQHLRIVVGIDLVVDINVVRIGLVVFFDQRSQIRLIVTVRGPVRDGDHAVIAASGRTGSRAAGTGVPTGGQRCRHANNTHDFKKIAPVDLFFHNLSSSFENRTFFY